MWSPAIKTPIYISTMYRVEGLHRPTRDYYLVSFAEMEACDSALSLLVLSVVLPHATTAFQDLKFELFKPGRVI